MKPYFRKFLGFSLGRRKYRFRAMPFGLNIAPRIFTKLSKAILRELRLKNINVPVYLDDWLVWASSAENCLMATKIVLDTLEVRGFLDFGLNLLALPKAYTVFALVVLPAMLETRYTGV